MGPDMRSMPLIWVPIWARTIISVSCVRVAYVSRWNLLTRLLLPPGSLPMTNLKTWSKWIVTEKSSSLSEYEFGRDRSFSESSSERLWRRVRYRQSAWRSSPSGLQYGSFRETRTSLVTTMGAETLSIRLGFDLATIKNVTWIETVCSGTLTMYSYRVLSASFVGIIVFISVFFVAEATICVRLCVVSVAIPDLTICWYIHMCVVWMNKNTCME